MNSIKVKIDKSEYGYDDFANYQIDNFWLDEKLEELYPNKSYNGLVPTLIFGLSDEEQKIVNLRILPEKGETTICPILMCPDDCDFYCTLIVAEIKNRENKIIWNKIGIDKTTEFEYKKIGSKVEWFNKIKGFEFNQEEYLKMISDFTKHYNLEKAIWKKQNYNLQIKLKNQDIVRRIKGQKLNEIKIQSFYLYGNLIDEINCIFLKFSKWVRIVLCEDENILTLTEIDEIENSGEELNFYYHTKSIKEINPKIEKYLGKKIIECNELIEKENPNICYGIILKFWWRKNLIIHNFNSETMIFENKIPKNLIEKKILDFTYV